MSARRHYSFGPRELQCGPGCRLVIGRTREGYWDAAYYRERFDGDGIGQRFAISKRVLLDALRVLFAEADEPFDADALVTWIERQSWGVALRGLTAERRPHPVPSDERLAELHGWSPDSPTSSQEPVSGRGRREP